ncbi:hypothetical protein C0J52_27879, partial [Blattella germanica]
NDTVSQQIYERQQNALNNRSEALLKLNTYIVPLRSYNMTGIDNIRNMLNSDVRAEVTQKEVNTKDFQTIDHVIDDLYNSGKRVIFTMGKGGVGKTTIAGNIARGLAEKGVKVHLTTTDPANHLSFIETKIDGITVSHIDEKAVLAAYQKNVLDKARETMGDADLSYIEEDLRSPCTQEIAVFNSFAEIVAKADNEVVVIDTAPTGHTLLLLDSTQSYHKEVERTQGNITPAVQNLLPRLRNEKETEVVIVTLPETTPVFEAQRLQQDLQRAGINNKWWVVNSSLLLTPTNSPFLKAKAQSEIQWIEKVNEISKGTFEGTDDPDIEWPHRHAFYSLRQDNLSDRHIKSGITYLYALSERLAGESNNHQPLANDNIQNLRRLVYENHNLHKVEDYARKMNLPEDTFNTLVKTSTGISAKQYILDLKITEAKRQLIYSHFNINEIAFNLGFEDPSYFTRLFKKKTSLSPSAFLKKYRKQL